MKKRIFILLICIFLFINLYGCGEGENKNSVAEDRLWYGITEGNISIVKEAIEYGCDLDKFANRNYRERTSRGKVTTNPVMIAMIHGEIEIAKELIKNGADVNIEVDRQGRSILHYSVEQSVELTETLIRFGADVNYKDKTGKTALNYSAKKKNAKTFPTAFYTLRKHGAKITENDIADIFENISYLQFGVVREMLQCVNSSHVDDILKHAFLGDSAAFKENVEQTNKDLLQQVTASFCDVSSLKTVLKKDSDFAQLLKCAVLYDNMECAEYILDNYMGDLKDLSCKELTYCVIKSGDISMLKLLDEKGVRFSSQDIVLGTIQYNQVEMLEYMINQGLNVNFETGIGNPLVVAVLSNQIEMVKMLIEQGANVNGNDNDAIPLIKACRRGYADIAQYLIESGADVNIVAIDSNKQKCTPILAAVYSGSEDCVLLLKSRGVDMQYALNDGENVYSVAERLGVKKICEILQES